MKTNVACFASFLACGLVCAPLQAQDWPQFRGPDGSGSSARTALPATWSDTENILWKAPLEGMGASTPVVVGGKLFLTTGVGSARDLVRHVLCFDAATGQKLWDQTMESQLPEAESIREDHGYASSTPVADASHLYVFFGKSGVFCFDHSGRQVWRADVGSQLNGWGSAASLTLLGNHLLVNACVESEALVSLDKATGKELWRASNLKECWHAPLPVAGPGGSTQIVMAQAQQLVAYDATTGNEAWRCKSGISWYMCPQPIVSNSVLYAVGGRNGNGGLAVKLGGSGEITESHRLWTLNKGTNVPSPVIHDGHLYFAHENKGTAHCVDLKSGQFVYDEPLSPNPGQIYASPVLVGDTIVYLGRGGQAVLVKAGPKFEIFGSPRLEDGRGVFNASPAIANGRLYLRSNRHLYCIGS
ncbi:MAG: PQQ-binding-like beta-propeller repeat protein [Verrucomicrobiales bacterium]|nr:PQQ-binding-like beta-propeller repeat protein [Verrucomicrobiales bacterium]